MDDDEGTHLMTSNQEGNQLVADVLGCQSLSSDVVSSIQESIQKVIVSLSAILPIFDQLQSQSVIGKRGVVIE